jgi:hypothetical protein
MDGYIQICDKNYGTEGVKGRGKKASQLSGLFRTKVCLAVAHSRNPGTLDRYPNTQSLHVVTSFRNTRQLLTSCIHWYNVTSFTHALDSTSFTRLYNVLRQQSTLLSPVYTIQESGSRELFV